MASPYTPGTEKDKLFKHAQNVKGNTDKAATLFAETNVGRGLFDLSGGTAVPLTNLPRAGSTGAAHSAAR